MEENKQKVRTLAEVKTEYNQLCFRAGNLQYEIKAKEKDLAMLNDSMRSLNFEYTSLQAQATLDAQRAEMPNLVKES